MSKSIIKNAVLNSGTTALYIILIAAFLSNIEEIFGRAEDTILAPVVMLLLFVISATITGSLVLGKPVLWYLEGKKKEAILLLSSTVAFLAIIALVFMLIIL